MEISLITFVGINLIVCSLQLAPDSSWVKRRAIEPEPGAVTDLLLEQTFVPKPEPAVLSVPELKPIAMSIPERVLVGLVPPISLLLKLFLVKLSNSDIPLDIPLLIESAGPIQPPGSSSGPVQFPGSFISGSSTWLPGFSFSGTVQLPGSFILVSSLAPPLLLAPSSFLGSDPPACRSATNFWASGYASALHPLATLGSLPSLWLLCLVPTSVCTVPSSTSSRELAALPRPSRPLSLNHSSKWFVHSITQLCLKPSSLAVQNQIWKLAILCLKCNLLMVTLLLIELT